jgi:hypothetical protein
MFLLKLKSDIKNDQSYSKHIKIIYKIFEMDLIR